MSRQEYDETKRLLQIELLKLQAWIDETGKKVCVIFEGRDAAGKGGTIKRFMEHLNPRGATVVALGIPTEPSRASGTSTLVRHLPTAGEIVLFDRSWYTRAVVERVMGYCTAEQYANSFGMCPSSNAAPGVGHDHHQAVVLRVAKGAGDPLHHPPIDPVRQWKLSPSDLASLDRWDDYTVAKEAMFRHTDTTYSPWTIVGATTRSAVGSRRSAPSCPDSTTADKDDSIVGEPDPLIVGPPSRVSADAGELRTAPE